MAWKQGISPDEPVEVEKGEPGSMRGPVPTTEYTLWLATSLLNYERLARDLVKHHGEKGRIIENVVKSALRGILPGRFSIGTGFAINALGHISRQLDIVIYDGHFNSPIVLEGGIGIFPIECVYAFIEVKSLLNGQEIEKFTETVRDVRDLASDKRYVTYGTRDDGKGNEVVDEKELKSTLPPRSFLFALKSDYANIGSVEVALRKYIERNLAHVHGLAVLDEDWFIAQQAFRHPSEFVCIDDGALRAFCASVLKSIQSVEMRPASMTRYLGELLRHSDG
jgi:hypothetical protein